MARAHELLAKMASSQCTSGSPCRALLEGSPSLIHAVERMWPRECGVDLLNFSK